MPPKYNVGLVCGKASGVTIIDFDHELFVDEPFNGFDLDTLKSGRIRGRGHIYFKYNPNLPASKHHDLGIEILNDGSNAVLPPSWHVSGQQYKWNSLDVLIIEMPKELEKRLLRLFQTETELKQIVAKCRHCFRDIIKRRPPVHGAEGREYMLAVCTDLKANGAAEEHARMFAKLMYREEYDENITMHEWRNIDIAKTWQCETLRAKLPAYVDISQCEDCKNRKQDYDNNNNNNNNDTHKQKVIDFTMQTDLGNAKRFAREFKEDIRYVSPWKTFVVWTGRRWQLKNEREMVPLVDTLIRILRAEAIEILDEDKRKKMMAHAYVSESESKIMSCIRLAASQPEIQALPDDFDKNIYLLNFQNGTVDLHTGVIHEYRREDMITRMCAVDYNPDALCPLWDAFLLKIFDNDNDMIKYLQKFIGMSYTGDVSEELFHIFHGRGANGKTTFLNTQNLILGGDYFKIMGVESLLKRGQKTIANDIARLQGTRIVWANEPEFGDVLTEGKIKKMVSKERILGEMKYREPVEFLPEYSLIMSTNPKPRIRGVDEGLRRRVRLIPFDVRIPDGEKDIHFIEKLKTELPGIAAWAVKGCLMWQTEGLAPSEKILQATEEYNEDMDPYSELFDTVLAADAGAITPFIILYTAYRAWAANEGRKCASKKAFSEILAERGFKKKTARDPNNEMQQSKGFVGVTVEKNIMEKVIEYLVRVKEGDTSSDNFECVCMSVNMLNNSLNLEKVQNNRLTSVNIGKQQCKKDENVPRPQDGDRCALDNTVNRCLPMLPVVSNFSVYELPYDNSVKNRLTSVNIGKHEATDNEYKSTNTYFNRLTSVNIGQHKEIYPKEYSQEDIIFTVKSFDKYNLTVLLEHYKTLPRVKEAINLKVLTELPDINPEIDLSKYINDYCHARGWE